MDTESKVAVKRRQRILRWKLLRRLSLLLSQCTIPLLWIGFTVLMIAGTSQGIEIIGNVLESRWQWLELAPLALVWGMAVEFSATVLICNPSRRVSPVARRFSFLFRGVLAVVASSFIFVSSLRATALGDSQGELSYRLGRRLAIGMVGMMFVFIAYELGFHRVLRPRTVTPFSALLSRSNGASAAKRRRAGLWLAALCGIALLALGWAPITLTSMIGSLNTLFLCAILWMFLLTGFAVWWHQSQIDELFTLGQAGVAIVAWAVCLGIVRGLLVPSGARFTQALRVLPATAGGKLLPSADQFSERWLMARKQSGEIDAYATRPYPVYLIAAEGGGLRAAYWSAQVLARLEDHSPEFADHVLAMSGVSGGALGLAVFSALVHQARLGGAGAPCFSAPAAHRFSRCTRMILEHDFLAPVIAAMLNHDTVASLVPHLSLSRDTVLIESWRRNVAYALGVDVFGQPLTSLWKRDSHYRQPALFLSSTWLESGMSVLASNVDTTAGPVGPFYQTLNRETWDEMAGKRHAITLGEAVMDSARFAYVSPTDRLVEPGVGVSAHLVDGGYLDNSGGLALDAMLTALMSSATHIDLQGQIVPIILFLGNNLEKPGLWKYENVPPEYYSPDRFFVELRAPFLTLDTARAHHEFIIMSNLQAHVRQFRGDVYELDLLPGGFPFALGWTMSPEAFNEMDRQAARLYDLDLIHDQLSFAAGHGPASAGKSRR